MTCRFALLPLAALALAACEPGGSAAATQTATLKTVVADENECFLLTTSAMGDQVLMGTMDACEQGADLEGQVVTLSQEPTMIDVP